MRIAAVSATVAVACGVAGLGLAGSVGHLVAHPRAYGTAWDAAVTGGTDPFLDETKYDDALQAVREAPDVRAAAGARFNNEGRVEGLAVPIAAFWTLVGPRQPWSVITAGRAPKNTSEVALGPKTMRALDLDIGDRTRVRMSPGDLPRRLTVVGETLVNDGFTVEAGEVALVDARSFGSVDERETDMILLRALSSHPDWRSIERGGSRRVRAAGARGYPEPAAH